MSGHYRAAGLVQALTRLAGDMHASDPTVPHFAVYRADLAALVALVDSLVGARRPPAPT